MKKKEQPRIEVPVVEAQGIGVRALIACGCAAETARSVSSSCVDAQCEGLEGVGLAHLLDYCEALRAGRVDGRAEYNVRKVTPVLFHAEAAAGFPHPVFDHAFSDLVGAAKEYGVAVFGLRGGYTSGALGYFARRLANEGMVAFVTANAGPAAVAASGSRRAVFSTNPLAFSVPRSGRYPLLIDQSSSQTALVNLRLARDNGETIPDGWALDAQGHSTNDPGAALSGVLMAFGGPRGANIALMVEMLAAGLTGANWSVDAPSYSHGHDNPGVGLFVAAINPQLFLGHDYGDRFETYFQRLEKQFHAYLPGRRREINRLASQSRGLNVAGPVWRRLLEFADEG